MAGDCGCSSCAGREDWAGAAAGMLRASISEVNSSRSCSEGSLSESLTSSMRGFIACGVPCGWSWLACVARFGAVPGDQAVN
jgi:hypothetical protein